MKTYEVNIVCDRCVSEIVTGGPMKTLEEASVFAETVAKKRHWIFVDDNWYCPDCQQQQQGVTP